jgi:endo-1,4-beta-xylanase
MLSPSLTSLVALAASLPLGSAQLDQWAKKAGMMYFGAATDTPGQRERAPYTAAYATYDSILRDPKQFGQTTPTNGMKWLFTEPQQGVFNFTEGEIVATIAAETNKTLRCHALVWHSQLAPWVEAKNWTKEELTSIIETHVANVAGHWKGRCYAWDVVNEALEEDGSYRKSLFYNILGEEYLKIAFKAAAAADPHAKLYYNDYNLEKPGPKSDGAVRIVKLLKAAGLKIDGVGMQAHLHALSHPTVEQHVANMNAFVAQDVDVAFTELDVRIELPMNASNLAGQKECYENVSTGLCVISKHTFSVLTCSL